jgi:ABC-type Mn2+/Zn2+ transport system ATPase subunit
VAVDGPPASRRQAAVDPNLKRRRDNAGPADNDDNGWHGPRSRRERLWHHRPVRLDEVWVRYRHGPWVLRDVTAELAPGEGATIVGPNGAGKSTLLKLAAGLLRPNRGTVRERPGRVGYVPERFPADQPFTPRRYLAAMAAAHGRVAADAAAGIEVWAERLRFTSLLDRPIAELSKGSAQKVGLMQAMLGHPELLVLDEPWEGLDAATRGEVPRIVADVLGAGGQVLISDHLGQTGALPGLRRWDLTGGVLREPDGTEDVAVIEIEVAGSEVRTAVENLRAAGHKVVNVRGREKAAT